MATSAADVVAAAAGAESWCSYVVGCSCQTIGVLLSCLCAVCFGCWCHLNSDGSNSDWSVTQIWLESSLLSWNQVRSVTQFGIKLAVTQIGQLYSAVGFRGSITWGWWLRWMDMKSASFIWDRAIGVNGQEGLWSLECRRSRGSIQLGGARFHQCNMTCWSCFRAFAWGSTAL